jgi:hypothetical protein
MRVSRLIVFSRPISILDGLQILLPIATGRRQ